MAKTKMVAALRDFQELQHISMREVCGLLRVNRKTIERWIIGGTFPKPIVLGAARSSFRFRLTDVEEFIASRPDSCSAEKP